MEEISLYGFFRFGYNFDIHRRGNFGTENKSVLDDIKDFGGILEKFNLKVTKSLFSSKTEEVIKKLQEKNPDENATSEDKKKLQGAFESINETLLAELKMGNAYSLTEKRLGLDKLVNDVDKLFGDNIFEKLSPICKKDFQEAGKCIAFERNTAAAFHILRGMEEVLRNYYKEKIKRNRLDPLLWNSMLDQLDSKNKISKGLLAILDNLRDEFRNPTAHPVKNYNADEVQNLYMECVNATNRMHNQK